MATKRNLEEYYQVRAPYMAEDGTVLAVGEIIHRKHPYFVAAYCEPVRVRHDVEQMTAAPGEKRDVEVTR